MNAQTQRRQIAGPAGEIECAVDEPAVDAGPLRGVVVICHPNPTQGGTMVNKVVQTIARAFVHLGYRTVRFNFRGIGKSQGGWDEGRGEVDDALAGCDALILPTLPMTAPFIGAETITIDPADSTPVPVRGAMLKHTQLFNLTGQPAVSLPLHWTPDGLPIGTQWVARFGDEATLFRLAAELETARPWSDRRPPGF